MDVAAVGLGTLGLRESAEAAVASAVELGCVLIDTGEHYGNLDLVGNALKTVDKSLGKPPIVIVKLSGIPCGDYANVRARLVNVLEKLGLECAEICLMHWPGLCDFDPSDMAPLATPADFQSHTSSWEEFCANISSAWANMSQLQAEGLVVQIGTSNFYQHHLRELATQCNGAVPFANEIFIDVTNQEEEFVEQMQAQGIKVLAYRPVIYKPYPDAITRVVERLGGGVSPQSVVLAWLLRRGISPLVKCRGDHIMENLGAKELQSQLTEEDCTEIKTAELGLKFSAEWFAKIWKNHNQAAGVSEDDVMMLVSMGVDEAKAREALEQTGGNIDAAMDAAFS
jgi:diketogulonate reductase-like aldo/keto reductase